MSAQIININDTTGDVLSFDWLRRAEPIHRQLRPKLPPDYVGKMQRVFQQGGRMCVAVTGELVVGVAVYRIYENTADGVHLYVDDLITDETRRSSGVGRALMGHLHDVARTSACQSITLDSGTWRHQAHKFYFREGMTISSFHFVRTLDQGTPTDSIR